MGRCKECDACLAVLDLGADEAVRKCKPMYKSHGEAGPDIRDRTALRPQFQTEWLPVEGTVPEFFAHLIRSIEAYAPHQYELKLSERVDKCAERAFLVEPVVNPDCPEEFRLHNPLPEFCEGLSVGDNIIVRVAEEEKEGNPDEVYFVAKVEEKAVKLEEAGTYSAVQFKKNDWIIFVRWHEFVPTKKNRRGDRFYKKGFAQWIPCGSIIRTLTQNVTLRWSGGYYQLSNEMNSHIEEYGDITH